MELMMSACKSMYAGILIASSCCCYHDDHRLSTTIHNSSFMIAPCTSLFLLLYTIHQVRELYTTGFFTLSWVARREKQACAA